MVYNQKSDNMNNIYGLKTGFPLGLRYGFFFFFFLKFAYLKC
jgi:hypothetical protein